MEITREVDEDTSMEEVDDMEDTRDIFNEMPSLGRQFRVGDFYNYRTDCITDGSSFWELSDLSKFTQTEIAPDFKPTYQGNYHKFNNNKWFTHLCMSVMTGLIDNYNGASHYFNDPQTSSRNYSTIFCRLQSKEEHLNLESLIEQTIDHRFSGDKEKLQSIVPDATHIVVGVIYGAEAYCVLNENLPFQTTYDIEKKMLLALKNNHSMEEFAETIQLIDLQERKLLSARLYSDLQTEPVRQCDVACAYQHLIEMKNMTHEGVPITALLCSLVNIKTLVGDRKYACRDIDYAFSGMLLDMKPELDEIDAKVELIHAAAIEASRPLLSAESLKKLEDLIVRFKEGMFKMKNLKDAMVNARKFDGEMYRRIISKRRENGDSYESDDEEFERLSDSDLHLIFQCQKNGFYLQNLDLEKWLGCKLPWLSSNLTLQEWDFATANLSGVTILASKNPLVNELIELKRALVLTFPQLDRIYDRPDEMVDCLYKTCEENGFFRSLNEMIRLIFDVPRSGAAQFAKLFSNANCFSGSGTAQSGHQQQQYGLMSKMQQHQYGKDISSGSTQSSRTFITPIITPSLISERQQQYPSLVPSSQPSAPSSLPKPNSCAALSLSAIGGSAAKPKPLQAKIREPSKIPLSAVEMPDYPIVSGLDVKFGSLEFGPSGFDINPDLSTTPPSMATASGCASYGSTYDDLSKAVYDSVGVGSAAGQTAEIGGVVSSVPTVIASGSAYTGPNVYGQDHNQLGEINTYDETGQFHTPSPYGLAGNGSAAPLGVGVSVEVSSEGPSPYGAQFMVNPTLAPHQSQHPHMMDQQLHQDSTTGTGQRSENGAGQQ